MISNQFSLEFIYLKRQYKVNYTIQTVPYKKEFLMYRLVFPLASGSKKEFVVFKDKLGDFSISSFKITVQQIKLLQSTLKEITRIERNKTQTIFVSAT